MKSRPRKLSRSAEFSLRVIEHYQQNVSAGKNLCPQGMLKNEYSCSEWGWLSIHGHGFWRGWWRTWKRVQFCRTTHGNTGCW